MEDLGLRQSMSQSQSQSMSQNHMLHGPASGDRQLPPSSSSAAPTLSHTIRPHAHSPHPHTSHPHAAASAPATTSTAVGTSSSTKHGLAHARFDPTHLPSQLPLYAPPSYAHAQSHDPNLLRFPDAPTTELAPILPAAKHSDNGGHNLPSLSSVTGPPPPRFAPPKPPSHPIEPHSQQQQHQHRHQQPTQPHSQSLPQKPPPSLTRASTTTVPLTHWPSLNPLTTYYTPSHAQPVDPAARMDLDVSNNTAMSAASPDRFHEGRAASVSLDDPDVRMAAEALGDLRADFINSPPSRHTPLPRASPAMSITSNPQAKPLTPAEEPLLALLTTSHPIVAKGIDFTTSTYNNSKNYSPRIKSSVEYVEGYLTPIANTVGTVGRKTGVEGGVRWFLGGSRRHPSTDLDATDGGSHKRRKVDTGDDLARLMMDSQTNVMPDVDSPRDPYVFKHDRRLSRASTIDSLPAYDDYRSPAYSENEKPSDRPPSSSNAGYRLIVSTSGLTVAMSEESLRSLKYCLRWLRRANHHVLSVLDHLKLALAKYEKSGQPAQPEVTADGDHIMTDDQVEPAPKQDRSALLAQLDHHKDEILKTLKALVQTVSKYTGGALPDNAANLIRRHLTTLPQRFVYASKLEQQSGEMAGEKASEEAVREGAHRVLVLAKEALDMMAQISGVLDGTIVSAEEWCERMGKKRKDEHEGPQTQSNEVDVKTAQP